jgi:hypothetical protein
MPSCGVLMYVAESLMQLVDAAEDCAVADEYAGKLAKMVVDTNVNAQEKGVEAACSCARKMPVDTIAGWAPAVMAKALDKAFGQVKVKAKAQELALLLIEAEQGEMVSPTATVSEVPCVRDIVSIADAYSAASLFVSTSIAIHMGAH